MQNNGLGWDQGYVSLIYVEYSKKQKLIVLSADLGRSSGLARFKIEFPKQYILQV